MSDSTDRPYPSRRQLREQGWTTGSLEALTETGSIRVPEMDNLVKYSAEMDSAEVVSSGSQPSASETPPPRVDLLAAPRSRRERREQERLIATGVIPVIPVSDAGPEPRVAQSSPGAPEAVAPAEATSVEISSATHEPTALTAESTGSTQVPSASTARSAAPTGPQPGLRPLSRRERREMENRGEPVPETGWIPIVSDSSDTIGAGTTVPQPASVVGAADGHGVDSPHSVSVGDEAVDADHEVVNRPAQTPRSASSSYSVQAVEFSVDFSVDETQSDVEHDAPATPMAPLPPVFQLPITAGDTHTAPAREISAATEATHALILPVAPSTDLTGPIGNTGEVLITGNLELPKYVSERALSGRRDFEEDFAEFESVTTESFTAPVRASDAVSTRTSQIEQPMIRSPRWGTASIVLGFSAAILGLTAVGLLALALLTDIVELPF